jgi:hypothetical protein
MYLILIANKINKKGQHEQNKHTQTSLLRVGLKPNTPAFDQALDREATVMGITATCEMSL